MGTRPEATLIYGIYLGHGYDEGSIYKALSVAEGLDLNSGDDEYMSSYDFPETAALYEIGKSGEYEGGYSYVVGPKGALFHTDWDVDKRLSVKDLQPKPEWSARLDRIAQVFGAEYQSDWYLMASYG